MDALLLIDPTELLHLQVGGRGEEDGCVDMACKPDKAYIGPNTATPQPTQLPQLHLFYYQILSHLYM